MKKMVLCALLVVVIGEVAGQLVRRVDYDAAFALQIGGETGMLTSFRHPKISLRPVAGLKMTFPFNRKWFLGSEVNYSELKYKVSGDTEFPLGPDSYFKGGQGADFDFRQIVVPVYLKYMLNCNRASVLFGFYGSYAFHTALKTSLSGEKYVSGAQAVAWTAEKDFSPVLQQWNAGITLGYEHQIVKHLNIMCRISAGVREVVKDRQLWGDKLLPLQGSLTLSYDILRIGDCGCD